MYWPGASFSSFWHSFRYAFDDRLDGRPKNFCKSYIRVACQVPVMILRFVHSVARATGVIGE